MGVSSDSSTSTVLLTALASPVSADSLTCKFDASISLPSAPTCTPASSNMMSPGTSCGLSISKVRPSRSTRTLGDAIFFRAARAFSARLSWRYPRMPLRITIDRIAIVSLKGNSLAFSEACCRLIRSKIPETIATAINISSMMSLN